mgnify:FL=1
MNLIFGADGFIGKQLSRQIGSKANCFDINTAYDTKYCDVRKPIEIEFENIAVIYNLAAIHKTPGHAYSEYFETNINGAKNV